MADLLITVDDIKQYRPVSLDQKRCDPFILEAQENDLRTILNDALYLDFVEKVFDTSDAMYSHYQNLLLGCNYNLNGKTINFPGIKPMLCYYTLSRIITNNQINITAYGVVQKVIDESTPIDSATLKMLVTELRSVAISYQSRLVEFLENNKNIYQLYDDMPSTSNNDTGLNFFSV